MITDDTKTVLILNGLIRVLKDSEKGFQTAADAVNKAELIELFARFGVQRAKFGEELKLRVKTLRGDPAKGEMAGGGLHRGWMELRATAASNEVHAILTECERGEDLAVAAYREALRSADLDKQSREILQRQYEAVQAAHDRVRQLRDGARYAHR
jgi:uncharacterized protein (TIGR02284 family)